jgi:hypothetical protein
VNDNRKTGGTYNTILHTKSTTGEQTVVRVYENTRPHRRSSLNIEIKLKNLNKDINS